MSEQELAELRRRLQERLGSEPYTSRRKIAKSAGVSPSTITNFLKGKGRQQNLILEAIERAVK